MSGDSTHTYPDVEIYIKDSPPEGILLWLHSIFDSVITDTASVPASRSKTLSLTYNDKIIPCVVYPDAVKGKFTSLWFKSSETPWQTDRDCALAAYQYFHTEIRCSISSWTSREEGGDKEGDLWLCFNHKGETTVRWNL